MAKTMVNLKKLGRTEDAQAVERTKTRDIESGHVSAAVYWTCDEVADFIETLGFPQYRVGSSIDSYPSCLSIVVGMFSSKRDRWTSTDLVWCISSERHGCPRLQAHHGKSELSSVRMALTQVFSSSLPRMFENYYKPKRLSGIEVLRCLMRKHSVVILNNEVSLVVRRMKSTIRPTRTTRVTPSINRF